MAGPRTGKGRSQGCWVDVRPESTQSACHGGNVLEVDDGREMARFGGNTSYPSSRLVLCTSCPGRTACTCPSGHPFSSGVALPGVFTAETCTAPHFGCIPHCDSLKSKHSVYQKHVRVESALDYTLGEGPGFWFQHCHSVNFVTLSKPHGIPRLHCLTWALRNGPQGWQRPPVEYQLYSILATSLKVGQDGF